MAFLTSLDLSNLKTYTVRDMSYLFSNCMLLEYLNIEGFNTETVYDMSYMFSNCKKLSSISFENFNTRNVKYMNSNTYFQHHWRSQFYQPSRVSD